MWRRIWRWGLAWRFRLFHRHRYRSLILEHVNGKPFVVLPDVFNPGLFHSGPFLAQQLGKHVKADAQVLDMGTGSGVGAIFAAQHAAHVTAADINPEAVRCAQINVLLNHMEGCIEVIHSNLFDSLGDRQFDVVLFNPPYFRGEPQDALDYAWRSNNTVERFAADLPQHLNADGFALVVLSTDGDTPAFLNAFRDNGLEVKIVAERDLINEILTVYKLSVQP